MKIFLLITTLLLAGCATRGSLPETLQNKPQVQENPMVEQLNELKPLKYHANYLVNRMKEFGILMSTDGPDDNVIKIKPPIIFKREDCDKLFFYLDKIFEEDFMKFY